MELEDLLNGGAQGSKILITARAELVARAAKSIEIHFLRGLSHEESWALFKQVAFKQGVEPESSTIVGIGKEVAERCVGVPLAIKTTASLLGLKERETDWVDFKKNVLPFITQDSEGKVVHILKLSYDNLSTSLKRCFAYCAIFPKDWEIEKDSLIRMWMAHGLIQLDGTSRSLEDVGEQHFMELAVRSLFEVLMKDREGTICSCKMHDLIHDLALSVGGNEFWSNGSDVNCIDVRTRHAWFSYSGPSISPNLTQAKKLRTLFVNLIVEDKDVTTIGDFKQLRVMHFYKLDAAGVAKLVAGWRNLTYLNLSGSDVELLPEGMCNMYNLQTLILHFCFNLKELPKGTRNLVSLRYLDVSLCSLRHMPRGMGELTSLQTLTDFVVGAEGTNCSELGELKSLVNLRGQLRIRKLRRGSKVAKCRSSGQSCNPTPPLAELQFITRLELEWSYEVEADKEEEEEEGDHEFECLKPHPNLEELKLRDYGGRRFRSWMERANIGDSLPNIRFIHLWSCEGWRHLPSLGLLPSLRELLLWDMNICDLQCIYDKEEDAEGKNRCFPALKKLGIWDCPFLVVDVKQFMSLSEVELSGDNMKTLPGWLQSLPHLQTLEVSYCKKMVSLPEWMGDLKSLQEIRLIKCKSIASIPDSLQHLTLLQRLEIRKCRKLYWRYNKRKGLASNFSL